MSPSFQHAGHGWTLQVAPGRGAKITSLRDSSGIEWLAQAAGPISAPGTPFVDAEMAGWDECAPSIVACEVNGRRIPDHGSLWDRVFEVRGDTARAVDDELGFEMTRRIIIEPEGVLLKYVVLVTRRQPFLWAAHPQFLSPPGCTVELPAHVKRLIDVTGPPPVEVPVNDLRAGAAELPQGSSRKWYLHADDRASSLVLRRRDGHGLEMSWSAECPYVGIWLDHAHYSREPIIAIEPSTGYFDSLAEAEQAGLVPWLEPGVPFTWWVRLAEAAAPTFPPPLS